MEVDQPDKGESSDLPRVPDSHGNHLENDNPSQGDSEEDESSSDESVRTNILKIVLNDLPETLLAKSNNSSRSLN
jgi:hypothetical protein